VSADLRPDDLLIERIALGDREAFAELYGRHRSDVCRFAAHMCGSASLAEDIVHEVFLALIGSASRYRPGLTTARLWLFGIARNHVRRARSLRQMLSLDDESGGAKALAERSDRAFRADADPDGDIDRRRDIDALRRAVVALPMRYREAVVLCDLQELSYADAAATVGCAIGTIRSRLHRGRTLLAKRLCRVDAAEPCPLPVTRTMP